MMTIETEEFYNLMQTYRHMPTHRQLDTVNAYHAVIEHVDARIASRDALVAALQEMIEVAMQVDGWSSFPSDPIDRAVMALKST